MKIKERGNFNKFYKTNPSGISLIVLVITIIVIIILAAAVILTLNKNNPIEEANRARYESDVANMQAIFTNTVAKVMAQNQGTIGINAGELNSVQTVADGVNSTEGRVNYTVNNPVNSSNENGTIIFNTGDNNATTYYTGRKLPLYPAGKTIWYVDSEGVISLKVGEMEYGKGDKEISTNYSMLQSWATDRTTDFHAEEYRTKISKIKLLSNLNIPETKIESWDVSEAKDGSIMAWIEDDLNEGYILYIAGNGKILANTDSSFLFHNFSKVMQIENLSLLDTSKVINMDSMFQGCKGLTSLDISSFNTSGVTSMRQMFTDMSNLRNINLEGIDTSKVTDMINMFWSTGFYNIDFLHNIDTSNVTNMYGMFGNCKNLQTINLDGLNTSKVTNSEFMFHNDIYLQSVNFEGIDLSNVISMREMFSGCSNLNSVSLEGINASKVTNMSYMFSDCKKLSDINLTNFCTSSVTNMYYMFGNCNILTSLDLSSFNTSSVTNMKSMFTGCSKLTNLDISSFNTSNVTDMQNMFNGCNSLTNLDLSNFNTSSVTNISSMFGGCNSLTNLDLSSFDTSNVTDMNSMFYGCISLPKLDLNNFNTNSVTDASSMFFNCMNLKSIGNNIVFDIGKTNRNIVRMFENCRNLSTTIVISSKNIENYTNIFYNAALEGTSSITINYTAENESIVDNIIASKGASNLVKGSRI